MFQAWKVVLQWKTCITTYTLDNKKVCKLNKSNTKFHFSVLGHHNNRDPNIVGHVVNAHAI